ncbi:hypothetical protein Y032_0196g1524 [Ancylostoma ceylanicum]|uniref:Uncharacterized protein n=1 Tax=Ancylostoma ceylanicum TaxID=53326 RepID=A0A016SPH5_9BILA|nr:hypothetical protein Y032_0196g1524 [Ancylostoma ceylanicum]
MDPSPGVFPPFGRRHTLIPTLDPSPDFSLLSETIAPLPQKWTLCKALSPFADPGAALLRQCLPAPHPWPSSPSWLLLYDLKTSHPSLPFYTVWAYLIHSDCGKHNGRPLRELNMSEHD